MAGRSTTSPLILWWSCLLVLLATSVHAEFTFPEGCVRSQFADVPAKDRCACAQATRAVWLDYLTFHYCSMADYQWASISLLSFMLCVMFYIVADTTDRFTVPAVTFITHSTKIEPAVAGATLLAFANGMPDLISCVASFSGRSKHMGFGVGGLLGSGLVISCFTLGYLAYLSNGFPVQKRPLMRDAVFYLIALAGLVGVCTVGYVTVTMSLMALCLYAMYTISIIWMKLAQEDNIAIPQETPQEPGTPPLSPEPELEPSLEDGNAKTASPKTVDVEPKDMQEVPLVLVKPSGQYVEVALDSPFEKALDIDTPTTEISESSLVERDDESLSSSEVNSLMPSRTFGEYMDSMTGWNNSSFFGKFATVILFPLLWARQVTVPSLNDNLLVHRGDVVSWAFWIPPFLVGVCTQFTIPSWPLLALTASASILGAVYSYLYVNRSWYFRCTVISLVTSSMWVFVVGHEIVAALHVVGVSLGISGSTLGILVLAWGNSIGDFVGNAALARQGHAQMATAACLAGPIFNTLVGGGFSLLLGCSQSVEHVVPLGSTSDKTTLRSGFLVLSLCLLSLVVLCCQYTLHVSLTKWFGLFLMVLYSVFCVTTIVEETMS
ncbi:unnamed protein product [Aphanomyces euteiches]|uniref:Sodium/calcium exchanger membrane region domain-containing protein n=1 Tax=Aphanomyces euteiches TaxID=100861 RepID=A0A6G0XRS6_9STRA|nr:hypothetical protein Ae201684_001965 [Aphanomyces euteiches]KAH9087344.1 hypothetical protein Ae201684P_000755 [Aphanomyces euteiches]KAH9136917.1 hypothetical protein AeRB84_018118 [Aphanomyces euteiches]